MNDPGVPRFKGIAPGSIMVVELDGFTYFLERPADWDAMQAAGTPYTLQVVDGYPVWRVGGAGIRWEPLTNGDAENPELLFYDGDVMMYPVVEV